MAATEQTETQIQIAIVEYLRRVLPHGWIPQHTPNKPRNHVQGRNEKRMGAVKGWPDIGIYGRMEVETPLGRVELPVVYFMEVKTPSGETSSEQKDVHAALYDMGFKVAVVRSIDDARRMAWNWGLPTTEVYPGPDKLAQSGD